jgi:hypothetical protein
VVALIRQPEVQMRHGGPDLLFHKYDMHSVMHNQEQQAMAAPGVMNDDVILNTPTDDIVETLAGRFRMDVPVLDRENAEAEHSEGPVEVFDSYFSRDYGGGGEGRRTIQGSIVELSVPYTGDKEFFFVQPTTYDTAPPHAQIDKNHVVLRHSSRELNAEQANKALNGVLDSIQKYLDWLRGTADPFNARVKQRLREAVEARKAKVLRDRNSVGNLGFKLKGRTDAPKTYVAPVTRKKIVPTIPKTAQAPFKPEPMLDDQAYSEILKIIENMTLVMERSPSAFASMGEEDIRQHFLVQLNGQFEGAASGETFNFTGKTDILIRVEGKNIFIAECKFWSGPKAFSETIDQLLGYLSWRDTKAAVIIFSRNRDFTGVLRSIAETADAHPHKKRGPTKEGDSRLRYIFGNPADHNREVFLTIMAFNVPTT